MNSSLLTVCNDLFHTAADTAFADLPIDGHRKIWGSSVAGFTSSRWI